ncbi:MAG: hypothetical protein ACI8UO_006666 [Verrucomicrobiales bacterium]|jgi:hypothetical protein
METALEQGMNINGLRTNWPVVRPKLKEVYIDLSDEDLDSYKEGHESQLIGRIQNKTRAKRQDIENQLDNIVIKVTAPAPGPTPPGSLGSG